MGDYVMSPHLDELIELCKNPKIQGRRGKWKWIPGYEGIYAAADTGDIFSVRRNRILVPLKVSTGYYAVHLALGGITKTARIAKIIASLFSPNPHNYPQINHIDGNKANNSAANLEWCTQSQNMQHAYATGLMASERTGGAKLSNKEVLEIRALKGKMFYGDIAKKYGVCFDNVSKIMRNVLWKRLVGPTPEIAVAKAIVGQEAT